jgi:hypothetical protein
MNLVSLLYSHASPIITHMESTTPIEIPAYLGIQDSRWPKEPRTFERFAVQEIRDSGENFCPIELQDRMKFLLPPSDPSQEG